MKIDQVSWIDVTEQVSCTIANDSTTMIRQRSMIDGMNQRCGQFAQKVDRRVMSNDIICVDLQQLLLHTYCIVQVERNDTIMRAAGCNQTVMSIPALCCCKMQAQKFAGNVEMLQTA